MYYDWLDNVWWIVKMAAGLLLLWGGYRFWQWDTEQTRRAEERHQAWLQEMRQYDWTYAQYVDDQLVARGRKEGGRIRWRPVGPAAGDAEPDTPPETESPDQSHCPPADQS